MVSIKINYGLIGPGLESREGQDFFSLLQNFQTDSGGPSNLTVFPGNKTAGV